MKAAIFFIALAIAFLVINRGAYRGYFDGDDLDNVSWSRALTPVEGIEAFTTGRFRAGGQIMYAVLGRTAGLRFPPYVAWIHTIHLLTAIVVYLLLRKLEFTTIASIIGTTFFAVNMAVFDIFWKPMYVFDVTCGLFCALAFLAWIYDRWVIALACYWIAFRSKEVAIMLPFVLLAYDSLFRPRRRKLLIPFFLVFAVFAAQAALNNLSRSNAYTLVFTPGALAATMKFYGPKLLFVAILLLAIRYDRRTWLGLSIIGLMIIPHLFLPGRLFEAYLYVPLLGLPIIAASLRPWLAPIALALWLPWNFIEMRQKRVPLIAGQHENQAYARTVGDFIRQHGVSRAYVFDGQPENIHPFGVIGLIRMHAPEATTVAADDPAARSALQNPSVTFMRWMPVYNKVVLTTRGDDASYITMGPETPEWQLTGGWWGYEGGYRWTKGTAVARLLRPPAAREFELKALIGEKLIEVDQQVHVQVLINGRPIGEHTYVTHGWQTTSWPVSGTDTGPVNIDFRVTPIYQGAPDGSHPMGIAIGGFGFK